MTDPHWTYELITKRRENGDATLIGTPKLPNAITILANHPDWRGVLAWDDFALRVMFAKAPPFHKDDRGPDAVTYGTRLTSEDLTRIASWFARTSIECDLDGSSSNMPIGTSSIEEAVIVVAKRNPVHPVRAYLDTLRWDGTPRVETWLSHYLGTVDNAYTRSVGRWWLISAIARIYKPGCQADHVLTLEGGQGEGKSTALRTLGAPWFTDEVADLSSKDALMQMHGVWMVEFAEFDTLSRSEAARSKAFITARIDRFRLPYSKTVEEFPRSCVCAATVNGSAYLKDDTGNRRFWPVAVANEHPIALAELERDRDQVLAEAVHLYRAGAPWWPSDPSLRDLLGTEQRERLIDDDWEQPIVAWLRERMQRPACSYAERVRSFEFVPDSIRACGLCAWCTREYGITTYDVLRGALELDKQRIDRSAQTRAGSCLLRLGYSKQRISDGDRRLWVYLPPPDINASTGPPLSEAAQ